MGQFVIEPVNAQAGGNNAGGGIGAIPVRLGELDHPPTGGFAWHILAQGEPPGCHRRVEIGFASNHIGDRGFRADADYPA